MDSTEADKHVAETRERAAPIVPRDSEYPSPLGRVVRNAQAESFRSVASPPLVMHDVREALRTIIREERRLKRSPIPLRTVAWMIVVFVVTVIVAMWMEVRR